MDTSPSVLNFTYSLGLDESHTAPKLNNSTNNIQLILTGSSKGAESVASASFEAPHHPEVSFNSTFDAPFERRIYGGDILTINWDDPRSIYSRITSSTDQVDDIDVKKLFEWVIQYNLTENFLKCLPHINKSGDLISPITGLKYALGDEIDLCAGGIFAITNKSLEDIFNNQIAEMNDDPELMSHEVTDVTNFINYLNNGVIKKDGAFLIEKKDDKYLVSLCPKIYDKKVKLEECIPEDLFDYVGTKTRAGIYLSKVLGMRVAIMKRTRKGLMNEILEFDKGVLVNRTYLEKVDGKDFKGINDAEMVSQPYGCVNNRIVPIGTPRRYALSEDYGSPGVNISEKRRPVDAQKRVLQGGIFDIGTMLKERLLYKFIHR